LRAPTGGDMRGTIRAGEGMAFVLDAASYGLAPQF
jgi:hypothetical protein